MRSVLPEKLESGRDTKGPFASKREWGPYGRFFVQGPCGDILVIVASGAEEPTSEGWEHVSVSTRRRCPNWTEMSFVKDLFWDQHECVIQFHPPRSEYVNNHAYCLHLWRPIDDHVRLPPSILVGLKDRGVLTEREAMQIREACG
jgi:hypothetical protein